MKTLGGVKSENGVKDKEVSTPNSEPEKIDFSKVKIEPLFEEDVDFDTFSKSDFRAVKVKECVSLIIALCEKCLLSLKTLSLVNRIVKL